MKTLPSGRGFYVWVLAKCEGGNVQRIIERCQSCGVSWLAIKVGNGGSSWMPRFRTKPQLTAEIVAAFHAAGIKVFGWSYDFPCRYINSQGVMTNDVDRLTRQVAVYRQCMLLGCDGVVSDSEFEWDRAENPDDEAVAFGLELRSRLGDVAIGDAPWPYTGYHPAFPFTKFGEFVDFRCPQVYWQEIGPVDQVFSRYENFWRKYEARPGRPIRPHYPSGSLYDKIGAGRDLKCDDISLFRMNKRLPVRGPLSLIAKLSRSVRAVKECRAADVALFECRAKAAGCPGVLHWEWSQCPARIWAAFESGEIPQW